MYDIKNKYVVVVIYGRHKRPLSNATEPDFYLCRHHITFVLLVFYLGVFFDRTPTTASAGGRFGSQQLFDQLDLTDIQPFVAGGQRRYVFAFVAVASVVVVVVAVYVYVVDVVACRIIYIFISTYNIMYVVFNV